MIGLAARLGSLARANRSSQAAVESSSQHSCDWWRRLDSARAQMGTAQAVPWRTTESLRNPPALAVQCTSVERMPAMHCASCDGSPANAKPTPQKPGRSARADVRAHSALPKPRRSCTGFRRSCTRRRPLTAHATPGRRVGAPQPPRCRVPRWCRLPRTSACRTEILVHGLCTPSRRQPGPRTNSDPRSSPGLVAASPRPRMLEQQSLLQ